MLTTSSPSLTMVAGSGNSTEWVAFQNDVDSSGFEAMAPPLTTISKKANRGKIVELTRTRSASNHDTLSVASWMKQPINSDASWAPVVPPPAAGAHPAQEHPTANKKRPPRTQSGTTLTEPSVTLAASRRPRHNPNGPNPVSSDSSSSSDRPSRGRSSERVVKRTGSKMLTSTLTFTTSLPVDASTGPTSSSLREARQPGDTSGRGRSRTRNRDTTVNTAVAEAAILQQPPAISRGRSSSRTRSSIRERSLSTTRRNTMQAAGSRPRSGSRPPSNSSAHRQRSTSQTPVTRSRSVSRTRVAMPPPSTSRTRRELRTSASATGGGVGGSRRRGRSVTSTDERSLRSTDGNIGRDISFGRTQSSSIRALTPKRSAIMEKLFGDQVSDEAKQAYLPRAEPSATAASVSSAVSWQHPERIHSRILLTATVYHNTATNLWIATINTNQKGVAKNPATASKYLKAFSFSSEKEARESAIANAPPKMMNIDDHSGCFICRGKFAMFRRASHCRNCGVCICNACSTTWPSKMIPETYNLKKESHVKICKSCNFLSGAFKKALVDGDYEEAIALYGSGNINLRTPFPQFSKKKEEVMYPIHCAVEGGNIDIVRWLMEDHFCPVRLIRPGSAKRSKKAGSPDFPILTSKNRSVLSISMESLHVEILRYLAVENGVSIYETKDLMAALRALEAVLLVLPGGLGLHPCDDFVHRWDDAVFDGVTSVASSLGADQTLPGEDGQTRNKQHNNDSVNNRKSDV